MILQTWFKKKQFSGALFIQIRCISAFQIHLKSGIAEQIVYFNTWFLQLSERQHPAVEQQSIHFLYKHTAGTHWHRKQYWRTKFLQQTEAQSVAGLAY